MMKTVVFCQTMKKLATNIKIQWKANIECCKNLTHWKTILVLLLGKLCWSMRNCSLLAASDRWVARGFSSLRDEVTATRYVLAAMLIRIWFHPLVRLIRLGVVDFCGLSSLRHEGGGWQRHSRDDCSPDLNLLWGLACWRSHYCEDHLCHNCVHILDGRLEHSGFLRIQLDLISVNNNWGSKKVNFTAVDSRVEFISKLGAVRSAVTRLIRHSEVWCPVVVIKTGLSYFAHCPSGIICMSLCRSFTVM